MRTKTPRRTRATKPYQAMTTDELGAATSTMAMIKRMRQLDAEIAAARLVRAAARPATTRVAPLRTSTSRPNAYSPPAGSSRAVAGGTDVE
jgi:hypothetical protein